MTVIALTSMNPVTDGGNDAKNEENAALKLDNTADVAAQASAWQSARRIELQFPKFTDGRAFSQATLLRRAGYSGDIRATGDVLVDQVLQMQRCGFSSAELRADQNPRFATELLGQFSGFYQGDLIQPKPLFARQEAA